MEKIFKRIDSVTGQKTVWDRSLEGSGRMRFTKTVHCLYSYNNYSVKNIFVNTSIKNLNT